MPLDASIYGDAGKIRSVADYTRDALGLQNAQQQNQLGALQLLTGQQGMQEKQRQLQEQGALRSLLGDPTFNRTAPDAAARVYQVAPGMASGVLQDWAKLDDTKSQVKLRDAQADKAKSETDKDILDQVNLKSGQLKNYISTATSPQQLAAVLTSADADPHLGPVLRMQGPLQDQLAELQSLKTPQDVQRWQLNRAKGVEDLMKFTTPDANAQLQSQTSLTTNKANNDRVAAEGAANRGVTMRGQNIARDSAMQGGSVQVLADGSMVVVPNRVTPGQPTQVSPVMAGGSQAKAQPKDGTGKISAEVQRQIGGLMTLDKDLGALEEAMKDFDPRGKDQFNTTKRAKIQSISKQAQLSAKEAAALGALSGPDMGLLEGILNDPTNLRGAIAGKAGIAAQIGEARKGNQRRVKTLGEQYGDKATATMAPELRGVAPASDIHTQADAILRGGK